MGSHYHDTLWAVFHRISHSSSLCQLSPQCGGKSVCIQLICGALAKSRGELLTRTVGIDLSLNGLGDGDHSSEISLPFEGILIREAEGRGYQCPPCDIASQHSTNPSNYQRQIKHSRLKLLCLSMHA